VTKESNERLEQYTVSIAISLINVEHHCTSTIVRRSQAAAATPPFYLSDYTLTLFDYQALIKYCTFLSAGQASTSETISCGVVECLQALLDNGAISGSGYVCASWVSGSLLYSVKYNDVQAAALRWSGRLRGAVS
jgi:hypothetical protein